MSDRRVVIDPYKLVTQLEDSIRTFVQQYTDARINEAIEPMFEHLRELYEHMTLLAEQVAELRGGDSDGDVESV